MSENTNGCLTRRKFINLMLKAGAAAAMGWTRIEALAADIKNKGVRSSRAVAQTHVLKKGDKISIRF